MKILIFCVAAPALTLALLAQPARARSEGAALPAPVRNSHVPQARSSGIENRVRLLAAELELDANQQARVRRILEDQRALTVKAWGDESVPSAVRVKATQAIGEQTADRIRAVLSARQRERYSKRLPPEVRGGTTSASVEGYIDATQRN
jgi:hypothetical protein